MGFTGGWRGGGGGGGGSGTTVDVVVPFAYAAMTDTGSPGTGVGVTWTYNSTTELFTVSFVSTQPNTNYTVVTDEEFADGTGSRYMLVQNKSTSGFEVDLYGGYGPSGDQKIIMVYAPDPEVAVGDGAASLTWTTVNNAGSPLTAWGQSNAADVDVSSGDVTVQLPSASSTTGQIFTIKHSAGSLLSNTLKITSAGGLIDGLTEATITAEKSSTRVSSDGSNWKVI